MKRAFSWLDSVWIARAACLLALCLGVPMTVEARGRDPHASDREREIGREVAVANHLADGDEHALSVAELLAHGKRLFEAVWTVQEGGGRPRSKGTGGPLSNASMALVFPHNFNRVSAPDANSCAGCHNTPVSGGGGDIVANVFVLGQRFDFVTFDSEDAVVTGGSVDEGGLRPTLDAIANSRNTLGMFGSGYIEMLARQMTADLQTLRDAIEPGAASALETKGVSFGTLKRGSDGVWDVSDVEGLPAPSLSSAGADQPPSLIVRPFHQAGAVVSLREFTNNAFNHHHGIQSAERFGDGLDPDGDGFIDELTRADVTAATVWQATLGVPGRVIPRDRRIARAIARGEDLFAQIGCTGCHVSSLPLDDRGWVYSEPNPYNPPGNLHPSDGRSLRLDLNSKELPGPRLRAKRGVVEVPALTDLKLHDITSGTDDPNAESLDMLHPAGSPAFFEGNTHFLTRKLWGIANEPPYFHHGQYTTMRQAVLGHHGEAEESRTRYAALEARDQDALIEFLKSLQILPPDTRARIVDERGEPRKWRAFPK